MKQTKRIRNGYPVYFIGLVAVFSAFVLRVHTVTGWIMTGIICVVAYSLARKVLPDEFVEIEKKLEPEPEPADPEVAALKKERDRAVSEMRRLNDNIPDETISAQIDRIERTTGRIFDYVMEHPEKKGQIRRFMNYYLPTTLKLLNEYDRMANLGVSGENINTSKQKIEEMLETACSAYDRQLDALFADQVMDITADVTVLQNMMKQEGLMDSDF